MTVLIAKGLPLTRRRLLTMAASSAAMVTTGALAKPYLSRAADRPVITHGVQSGDVTREGAVVWARADRPARMLLEAATTNSFKSIRSAVFVDALPETDFTAKVLLEGLPPGQDISIGSPSRTIRHRASSANRRSDTSAPRRATGAASRSSGPAIPRARAGASIPPAGDIAATPPCCKTVRTSSSIPAITFMPIVRCHQN